MRPRSARGLLVALVVLLAAPGAAAHAEFLSSEPAKGARLDDAPASVSVTLTEPVDPQGTTLRVIDVDGERVDLGDMTSSGGARPTLRVSLPEDLPDGAYRILWQALSGHDGHVTDGTVGFAVGDFTPPGSRDSDARAVPWLGASGRFLAFAGLALGLGAALFLVWVPGAAAVPRRPALEALLAGASLHLVGVVLLLKSTMDETGLSDAGLASTALGKVLLLRTGLGIAALAFAGIAILPRLPARLPPHLAVLFLAAAGLGSARFSHASTAGLAGMAVDAMHLFAAAAWVGGLLVFLWVLVDAVRDGWTADAVRVAGVRFGTAALVSVILLLAAGVGSSLAILGTSTWTDPGSALASAWAQVLAAKVALTVAMLALGAVNRYGILEPATSAGFSGAMQRLVTRWAPDLRVLDDGAPSMRRLLKVEAGLGVAVLALAGILTSIPPPAEASALEAGPFEVTGVGNDFHGILTIDPAPVVGGTSTLRLHVETHLGAEVEDNSCGRTAPESCVTASVGAHGGERHAMQALGGGDWQVQGILWTTAGETTVTVTVSTSEVPSDDLAFTFTIGAAA
jgi:copper transport protein